MQFFTRFRRQLRWLACVIGMAVVAAGCATRPAKITFFDQQDASTEIENAIAEYITTNGYGYQTQSLILDSAVGNKSLADGQLDVNVELWRFNFIGWYNQSIKSHEIIDLGNMYQKSTQGFYIPYYTAQAHPNLKSVSQLKQYWQIFKDPLHPSQGFFINCMIGWHCHIINEVKLQAYGLSKDFYIETPGSSGAEEAAIIGAYEKHQNFVAYWWEPDALLKRLNLVQLKEPPFTAKCNNLQNKIWDATNAGTPLSQALAGVTPAYGCAYQIYGIHKGVNAQFAKTAPDFIAFFKKMEIGNGPLEAAELYYSNHNKDVQKTAMWFFAHYQKEWESWVPAKVAAKVKTALVRAGVKLG